MSLKNIPKVPSCLAGEAGVTGKRKLLRFTSMSLGCFLFYACHTYHPQQPPEINITQAGLQVAEGFQVELLASEPLVSDPVAMEIDEAGRLYVVEMHGYPLDKSGSGKVRLLTDTDGDGRMDESKVFADRLMLPTGVLRWKKGILVTDAPNVLYLEDTDGDGKSDVRDTLLTGFALSNPQHNLNNPILGTDNWIYLGHEPAVSTQTYKSEFGDRGGDVYYPHAQNSPRLPDNARGRSVRFRPDKQGLEILSAQTQFGHSFDTWGRYFLVSNANHIIHQVMPATYLGRNPNLLVTNATQTISDHGAAAEVFPITQNPQNQLLTDVGVFTSACGTTVYQGGLFPAPYDSVTFVAEPVSNIVHADILREKGSTFSASRIFPKREFLASTDAWFRPVNMYTGPDGALYVVDYYRQIIEHPEWMADDAVQSGALYNGREKGRIYRITPRGTPPASWSKELRKAAFTNVDLVKKLSEANIWWRRNAQRLLIDRNAREITGDLEKLAVHGDNPAGRLHALWTLEGLGRLTSGLLMKSITDPVPGVRENAVKLSEQFLRHSPSLQNTLFTLHDDPDPKVRFQLLCSLGYLDTREAAIVREKILFRDISDPWVQIAALSAMPSQDDQLLHGVLAHPDKNKPVFSSLIERLATMTAASGVQNEVRSVVQSALRHDTEKDAQWQAPLLNGLAEGLRKKDDAYRILQPERTILMEAALNHPLASVRKGSVRLLKLCGLPEGDTARKGIEKAVGTVRDRQAGIDNRIAAIGFLSIHTPENHTDLLKSLISPGEPVAVQLAALNTIAAVPGPGVSEFVVKKWGSLTPEVRNTAINTFMAEEKRITLLLDAVEQGTIDASSIGWPRSVGLMAHPNSSVKRRARSLLTKKEDGRQEIVKRYTPALNLKGDAERGKLVFSKNCAACHQIGGRDGTPYGPDLGTIRNRRPESIMGDILNPNLSIADGFDIWTIELVTGETIQGLIATETPSALTVRNYGGQETVVGRSNIKSLKALGMSVMPAGLESEISVNEMADLLQFLKHGR